MQSTRYQIFNHALRLGALCLLLLLAGGSVAAQTPQPDKPTVPPAGEGQPVEPVVPDGPEKMSFQPSANARAVADFAPPRAQLIDGQVVAQEVTAFNQESMANARAGFATQTIALNTRRDNAVRLANDKLNIVVEKGTFAQPVGLEVRGLTVASNPPLTRMVDGQEVRTQENATLMRFELEMVDGQNRQINGFDKNVRMVVDMRDHGIDLSQDGGYFYLAYEDETEPGKWLEVPITAHDDTGLISAEVSHFSDWQAGWRPEAWAMEWRPPSVSEFTGAAAYQYPIQVPPGRAGLQPSVGLSYSSASLRGVIQKASFGNVATGWSLNEISIMRTGIENGASWWNYPNNYRLTVNGVGGRLISTGTENGVDVFRVEDQPQFKVYNYGGQHLSDEDNNVNTYWVIKDGSGTQYRLGYTDTAYSYQEADSNDPGSTPEHRDIIAWHVDTITDAYGNQITYDYFRHTRSETTDGYWCPWGDENSGGYVCLWNIDTHNSQVSQIQYNFAARVQTAITHDVPRLSGNAASKIVFNYDANETRLASVDVYHGGLTNPMRRYAIDAQTVDINNPSTCDVWHVGKDHTTRVTSTRVVNWIEEQAIDPTTGNLIATLPRTTFGYETLANYHKASTNTGCFLFQSLSTVENGYGGQSTFTYYTDGRVHGNFENCKEWVPRHLIDGDITSPVTNPCNPEMPSLGFNYSVDKIAHNDGINPSVITDYDYTDVCYDQTHASEHRCKQPETKNEYGNIGGYGQVTVTTYDYDGTTALTKRITEYHNDNSDMDRYGRSKQTQVVDPTTSTPLSLVENEYAVDSFTSNNIRFTYTKVVTSTQYPTGSGTGSISTKTVYDYGTFDQGGDQYGNVTLVEEYDDANAAAPYRSTRMRYEPNATITDWLVNLIANQAVYSGTVAPENLQTATWTYYDDNSDWEIPASQGRVTYVRVAEPISCTEAENAIYGTLPLNFNDCDKIRARRTVDSAFDHDDFGNVISTTNSTEFGYRVYELDANDNWQIIEDPTFDSAEGRSTTITYDSTYNLYPVSSVSGGHETKFEIYDFNDPNEASYDAFQQQQLPGQLRKVISPQGLETIYEYDPFGRLWATYESEADLTDGGPNARWDGNPLSRTRYWDNGWESYLITSTVSTTNLALGATVTSSSEKNGNLDDYVVDGNLNTRWGSSHGESECIYIDLGVTDQINKIILDWEAAYAAQYEIQFSNTTPSGTACADNTGWTTAYTELASDGGTDVITSFSTQSPYRYVRIKGTAHGTQWGYSLFEIEVHMANNHAYNKTVASSSTTNGKVANYAVDNNWSTRWSSSQGNPECISVDLGSVKTIDQVKINWESAYAEQYDVQVSNASNPGNNCASNANWTTVSSVTNGNGGTDTITTNTSGRHVRIKSTKHGSKFGYSLWELEVYSRQKYSQGKPVYASSVRNGNVATYAVDGNSGTRWTSQFTDSQCIYVDLGSVQTIKQVLLNWETAYGSKYKIQVSNGSHSGTNCGSDSGWTTVYNEQSGNGGIDTINLNSSGRYVRMKGIQRATSWGYSLWEFEVYTAYNAALGKTTNSSSTRNGNASSYAVDGNTSTRWGSELPAPECIYVDLGSEKAIRQVVLSWEAAFAESYQIQVSNGGHSGVNCGSDTGWSTAYSTTTGNGGTDVINLTENGRYVRMKGITRGSQWGYSLYEFEVFANDAKGKAATASSERNGNSASLAVDGDYGTRWGSAWPAAECVVLDLGAEQSITDIVLHWETAYATHYEVQLSNDALNSGVDCDNDTGWTEAHTELYGDGGVDTIPISEAGRHQYVRLINTERGTSFGYSLWEIEVIKEVTWLDIADNQPFFISTHARPSEYDANAAYEIQDVTYFDGFGRPMQTRTRDMQIWGTPPTQQDVISSLSYDALGNVVCQSTPYATTPIVHLTDNNGFIPTACDETAAYSTTVYDYSKPGRMTTIAPDGVTKSEQYANLRNDLVPGDTTTYQTVGLVDANGHRMQQLTNARGELIYALESTGATTATHQVDAITQYGYDVMGNLLSVQDAQGHTTTMTYNGFGQKVEMNDPDMGLWEYKYNAAGNLTSQIDAKGQNICFYYDDLDRLIHKTKSNGAVCPATAVSSSSPDWLATYTYDTTITETFAQGGTNKTIAAGGTLNLAKVEWRHGTTGIDYELFAYDDKGRLTDHARVLDGRAYLKSWNDYDSLNQITKYTLPNGEVVDLGYDREGVDTFAVDSIQLVAGIGYNAMGQMEYFDRTSAGDTDFDYFTAAGNFRLDEIANVGQDLPTFSYTYDNVGNILTISEAINDVNTDAQTFGYDHLNRLITADAGTDYGMAYTYDKIGNIDVITNTLTSETKTYGYNSTLPAPHTHTQPHAVTSVQLGSGGSYTYSYDPNGNMISRIDANGTFTQTFDLENRLQSVTYNGTDITTFYYDTNGQRTITVEPDGTTTYYPFPEYEEAVASADTIQRVTYSVAGQAVAVRVSGDPDAGNNGLFYLYSDHLGSASALQHPDGSVTQTRYMPFGGYRAGSGGNAITDRGYTGHKQNDYIGLIYMNARFYVPGIGRFASADTIVPNPTNPQSFNRFSYVRNNPLGFIDPSGHCDTSTAALTGSYDQECWDIYNYLVNSGYNVSYEWEFSYYTSDISDLEIDSERIGGREFSSINGEGIVGYGLLKGQNGLPILIGGIAQISFFYDEPAAVTNALYDSAERYQSLEGVGMFNQGGIAIAEALGLLESPSMFNRLSLLVAHDSAEADTLVRKMNDYIDAADAFYGWQGDAAETGVLVSSWAYYFVGGSWTVFGLTSASEGLSVGGMASLSIDMSTAETDLQETFLNYHQQLQP